MLQMGSSLGALTFNYHHTHQLPYLVFVLGSRPKEHSKSDYGPLILTMSMSPANRKISKW